MYQAPQNLILYFQYISYKPDLGNSQEQILQ